MTRLALVVTALIPWATVLAQTTPTTSRWSADPNHSAVGFRVRHLGITWVNGTFGQWTADLIYDPGRPEAASVTAKIQAASINTGNAKRDNDVRQDYLAADSFPEITFISKRVEKIAPDRLRISGDLTMKGVTRPTVLEADVGGLLTTSRGRRTAFSATTTVRRQDYGITLNNFMEGAQVVGDDVKITIDLEATERATTP